MSDLDRTTVENALIGQEFELSQPAAAHAAIEARSTTGKTLLAVSR
jgi:NADPH:quinone reductase-like Zn-dependent oxidoreductase